MPVSGRQAASAENIVVVQSEIGSAPAIAHPSSTTLGLPSCSAPWPATTRAWSSRATQRSTPIAKELLAAIGSAGLADLQSYSSQTGV